MPDHPSRPAAKPTVRAIAKPVRGRAGGTAAAAKSETNRSSSKAAVKAVGQVLGASDAEAEAALPARPRTRGIVSSSHLVSPRSVELSEFEFGLIVAWNAFSRWAVRCMAAAGCPDLTFTDVLLMHHISHRARNKKLADICFVLNYEDTHVVAYSLKKLVAAGWVAAEKVGKEVFYSATPEGEAHVNKYREVREACLVDSLDVERNHDIGEVARLLRTMSGLYDQAARAATSL